MSKKRILIVDDEEHIRDLISEMLKFHGYEVISAQDGFEALNKVKNEKVDLILLDIKLPGLDGYEVFKMLLGNKKTKNIPVIVLSASDVLGDINRFMSLGAKDYILKSRDVEEWLKKIKKYL